MHKLIEQGYIPLDKSWIIRMGMLDFFNGYDDIFEFLESRDDLCDDLQSLERALVSWKNGGIVDVGESGTIYNFLRYKAWLEGEEKEFVVTGSLVNRAKKFSDESEFESKSLEGLLTLNGGSSQVASAAVLFGRKEVIDNPPFKLQLTYEAVEYWYDIRERVESWIPRYDKTILRQAETFLGLLKGKVEFEAEQPEDYCFARVFDFISREEGEKLWPHMVLHESNRFEEMEREIRNFNIGNYVWSGDHRVVQPIGMYGKAKGLKINFRQPSCVNKSWPQFWKFLKDSPNL